MIVVIPIPDQVYPELFWKRKRRFEIDSSLFDFEKPQRILQDFGKQYGIPVCDVLPGFKVEGKKEKLYYRYNVHWNKNGHRLAGQLIDEKLKTEGLVPGGSGWLNK